MQQRNFIARPFLFRLFQHLDRRTGIRGAARRIRPGRPIPRQARPGPAVRAARRFAAAPFRIGGSPSACARWHAAESGSARRAAHGCRRVGAPAPAGSRAGRSPGCRCGARRRSARGRPAGRAAAWSRRSASAATPLRPAPARGARARSQSRAPTKASIACRSLKLQKPSSIVGAQAAASSAQRVPVLPPSSWMRHSSAEASIRSAISIECAGPDAPVVQRQRLVELALRQVEQRQVPPAMRRDDGVDAPAGDVLVHPAHAGVGALGHLEHMRHHVVRPRVECVQGERCAGGLFGALVLAAFLEAEGVHRQHRVVARQFARPRRQHRRHAVIHAVADRR